jgi:PAS domain S-box-containing protein
MSRKLTYEELERRVKELEGEATERKRMELFCEPEQPWRYLLENSPTYIALADRDGTIQYINRTARGITMEEVVGKNIDDFKSPVYHEISRNAIKKVFQYGESGSYQVEALGQDKTTSWFEVHYGPIKRNGQVVAIAFSAIDITPRKQAEEKLAAQEEFFRALIENSAHGVVVLDADGRVIYTGPSHKRILGHDGVEEYERSFTYNVHPDDVPRLVDAFARMRDNPDDKTLVEARTQHVNGNWLTIEATGHNLLDNPSVGGIVINFRDVTERRRAEEALREERHFSENLIQCSPTFFVAVSPEGQTLMMNETMLKGLGYEKEEVLGTNYLETFVPEDEGELLLNLFNNLKDLNEVVLNESNLLTKDGRKLLLEWHTRPMMKENGRLDYFFSVGIDITARKQSEKELQESEERFRAVFEGSLDAIFLADPESGKVIGANPAAEELLSRPVEEIIGLHQTQLHPAHLKSSVEEKFSRHAREEDKERPFESSVLRSDGQEIPVEILAHIIQIDGVPVLYGTFRDITERKRVEEALVESEQRYRLLAESTYDIIWTSDMDLRFSYLSPSVERFIGYSPEELIGKTIIDHLTPSSTEAATKTFLEAFAGENAITSVSPGSRTIELQRFHKNGSVVWGELTFTFLRDDEGRLAGILGVTRDITERKKAAKALQESEEKYRRVVQDSIDAVIIVQGLNVRFVNQGALRMWGYQREEEMVGRLVTDLVAPDYRELIEKRGRARERGEVVPDRYEFKALHKEGSEFHAELLVSNIIYQGVAARQGVIRDITERKRLEEELMKAQRIESLGVLAGGIAHDFNNILTPILSNISMARIYGELGSEVDEMLTDAEKATLRAKSLTQQLLTFSKGGAPVKKIASISKLLSDSSRFALSGSSVTCKYSIPEDLWSVEMDEGQVGQVIHNLVINADQASPAGGTIKIGAENVVIGPKSPLPLEEGKYVSISIADSGIGIPGEHLSRIFDPFYTTKVRGSGLGLSTSFTIIKQHKGTIQVNSELGAGTVFHIYLPASEEALVIEEKRWKKARTGHGRILVIDDEQSVRRSMKTILNRLGYEVKLAEDGAEGIRVYEKAMKEERPFDLVIMDLTIPGGLGGQKTMEKLKRIDPGAKVIVSSGYSDDPVLSKFQDFGFSEVLAKPYKAEDLVEVIHKVLDGV